MKVLISVIRRTEYTSIVEMSEEDFKKYNNMLDCGSHSESAQASRKLNSLIDTRDWQDDSFDSLEDFREFKE